MSNNCITVLRHPLKITSRLATLYLVASFTVRVWTDCSNGKTINLHNGKNPKYITVAEISTYCDFNVVYQHS